METATSQVIGQLSGYMRGLTQRLDPGAGWYGEFLRRDPEGMRACLDGAAMPPWDVLESLLGDLAASAGPGALARETQYAAGLRAAAVGVWDRLPGGTEELRTLLASAAEQRARARAALGALSARLAETTDPAQAQALSRELSWTRDDEARATARHEDLTTRLEAVTPAPGLPGADWPAYPPPAWPEPLNGVPAQRTATSPGAVPAAGWPGPRGGMREGAQAGSRDAQWAEAPADAARNETSGATSGAPSDAMSDAISGPVPEASREPVGRAEGRWLRGARRSHRARYAGAAAPEARAVAMPPGQPPSATPLRGARFGPPARPAAEPAPAGDPAREQEASAGGAGQAGLARGARHEPGRPGSAGPGPARPGPAQVSAAPGLGGHAGAGGTGGHPGGGGPHGASDPWAGAAGDFVEGLAAMRGQGRSGEAHVLLCEAAAGPAERLVRLGEELRRAGLAADWATLLWEAASLPPARFAAAAAALGPADRDALLRQGAARPAAEIAEAALVLAEAGHAPEADALLAAFVRVRTAEESARLARRDPRWFAPRLLHAAEALSGAHHRDLLHALRVANLPVA
ncbi:hypothetical protein [Streptomyces sp. AP-93]|uniref:hypothetical protein n=1 Tax=Streptomyces sp. AP-93 TaxID=2929048 RepID=UPI001FAEE761|nr:hypothetical protein [Streptomyces sp. AP-93]MCJ0873379.1 hypothetical protein [Streptomyces sp. AP-93]